MVNKLTNIKARVLQIAKYKGITYEIFCDSIGMTYGSFKGAAKYRPLNSDAIGNIVSTHNDINAEWLITGNGEMLKKPNSQDQGLFNTSTEDKNTPWSKIELVTENKYLRKRIDDLEVEKERITKALEMKNELIKSFYESRISYIPLGAEAKTNEVPSPCMIIKMNNNEE